MQDKNFERCNFNSPHIRVNFVMFVQSMSVMGVRVSSSYWQPLTLLISRAPLPPRPPPPPPPTHTHTYLGVMSKYPRDMLISLQMGVSFVRAAVAYAILERTSDSEPSSEATAPRYLKFVTAPNFCPFTVISLWTPLALFVISLVFSDLSSILYLVQALSRLSTRASSSCSSSSVNRRLVIFLPPMLTFSLCSSKASDMIRSKKILRRVGGRSHPCLTPTVVLNHSPMRPFIWTALVALS